MILPLTDDELRGELGTVRTIRDRLWYDARHNAEGRRREHLMACVEYLNNACTKLDDAVRHQGEP